MEKKYTELFNITPPGSDEAFIQGVMDKTNTAKRKHTRMFIPLAATLMALVIVISGGVYWYGEGRLWLPAMGEFTSETFEDYYRTLTQIEGNKRAFKWLDRHPEFKEWLFLLAWLTDWYDFNDDTPEQNELLALIKSIEYDTVARRRDTHDEIEALIQEHTDGNITQSELEEATSEVINQHNERSSEDSFQNLKTLFNWLNENSVYRDWLAEQMRADTAFNEYIKEGMKEALNN